MITKYMVPTGNVVHSEPEREYDKEIAKGRINLNLNRQSKEPTPYNLESSDLESAHLIGNGLVDKVVHTLVEIDYE